MRSWITPDLVRNVKIPSTTVRTIITVQLFLLTPIHTQVMSNKRAQMGYRIATTILYKTLPGARYILKPAYFMNKVKGQNLQ